MKSKKRKKTYYKRNKKIRIILINLIIIVLFVIFMQLILQLVVPATKASLGNYSEENLYEVNLSEKELAEMTQTPADEVNSYGETINITTDSVGSDYNINLYDTTNSEVNYAFKMTDMIDEGINTHDMPVGSYFLQLDDGTFLSYDTDFTLDFNTITRDGVNNKIEVNTVHGLLHITKYAEATDDSELDILVDAGHGGDDSGASSVDGSVYEKDLNLELATIVANDLTNLGYNVALTREDDTNPGTCEDNISSYCSDGRVSMAYNDSAKIVLSVHHNTGGATGYEVYTSYYASEALANLVAANLAEVSTPSTKLTGYVTDGVYQEVFEDDVDPSIEQDYMYMIRETGGIATNSLSEENEANNTKPQGSQGLLIEFGYLDDYTDLAHVTDSSVMEAEATAVVNAVDSYLNSDTTSLIDLNDTAKEE